MDYLSNFLSYTVVLFTYKAALYSGKPKVGNGHYYIDCTESYAKYLAEKFEKDI